MALAQAGAWPTGSPASQKELCRALWTSNGLNCPHTPQRPEHTRSATLPLTRAPHLETQEKGQEGDAESIRPVVIEPY